MTLKLSRRTKEAMGIIRHTARTNIVEMAKEIDADPQTFFENEDWSGLDLRECDVAGVSFRGANLDGVQVYQDQWNLILATAPASHRDVEPELRPEEKPFPGEVAREAYAKAERRIEKARREGAQLLYVRGQVMGASRREKMNALDRLPPQISTLTSLQHIYLNNTQVSDISPLVGLTALQRLNLDWTQVSDLAPLGGLIALQTLSLINTQVSDIAPLGGLITLQRLNLHNTPVKDLSPIQHLIEDGLTVYGK